MTTASCNDCIDTFLLANARSNFKVKRSSAIQTSFIFQWSMHAPRMACISRGVAHQPQHASAQGSATPCMHKHAGRTLAHQQWLTNRDAQVNASKQV
jgi:hypothetical protein